MRVIGGSFKGRRLSAIKPEGNMTSLRPTTDRIKESLFNILSGGKFDLRIEKSRILDIFAGSGALGLEAISRGAKYCTFIEKNEACVRILNTNLNIFNIKNQTNIKTFDATNFPMNPDPPYDLVFLDPPYRKSLGEAAIISALASNWISDHALIVLEEGEQISSLKGLKLEDTRRYGGTILHFFKRLPY
jgi:16S rRNA (guanine966-N2)-methyltransferase